VSATGRRKCIPLLWHNVPRRDIPSCCDITLLCYTKTTIRSKATESENAKDGVAKMVTD